MTNLIKEVQIMMLLQRRSSDWKKVGMTISCHELMSLIMTDSLPPEFGEIKHDRRNNQPLYIVEGTLCIPKHVVFDRPLDFRNIHFENWILSDNPSFEDVALFSEGTVISSSIQQPLNVAM